MDDLLAEFNVTNVGSLAKVEAAEAALKLSLPSDYREFLCARDGGEGFIGEHYLILWAAAELHQFNVEYEFPVYAPELVAFGSNGGGESFAFDTRKTPFQVVMVPFIGMDDDAAVPVANSFGELLLRMKSVEALF